MMNCDKAKELLSDYVDGTLDIEQKRKIEEHLNSDEECKKLFEHAQLIKNHLKNLPTVNPSEEFDIKLRQKIIKLNKGEETQPRYSIKGLSITFSGILTLAVLYVFIFPDSYPQGTGLDKVAPASNINNAQPQEAIVDNEEAIDERNEIEVNSDSLKNEPEEVDNSKIKLTGDQ